MDSGKRRILFACTTAFTMATLYRGLFPYLEREGWEIEVVIGGGDLAAFDPFHFGNPVIHRLSIERELSLKGDIGGLVAFIRLLAGRRYDIIHVSTPKASLLGSIAAFVTRNGPVVFVYRRRVYELMTGLKQRIYIMADRVIAALSKVVIPISRQLGDQLVADAVCRREKLSFIGSGSSNGIDVSRFERSAEIDTQALAARQQLRIPQGAPVMLYVGRIIAEKGVDLLPDVFERVRRRFPDVHFVLIGPEDDRDPVSPATLDWLRGGGQVHWLGYQQDTRPWYALADVFVFPSYFEGFGNVLLEAAAMRTPAVAFDVPGVREAVVDGVTGHLGPSGDVDAMAASCMALLTDDAERARIAEAGHARVHREFASAIVHAQLNALFASVARAGR